MEDGEFQMTDGMLQTLYGALDNIFDRFVSEHSQEIMENALGRYAEGILSDERKKRMTEMRDRGGPLSNDEIMLLMDMAGPDSAGFGPEGIFGSDDDMGVTEDMLDAYAEHLRNYLYNYKDEAQDIDPSIDPEEEHAGPMAQDIEKVAPDCVKETPEGVKTVDGERLALVNAGVIGELARRVKELEERIYGGNS